MPVVATEAIVLYWIVHFGLIMAVIKMDRIFKLEGTTQQVVGSVRPIAATHYQFQELLRIPRSLTLLDFEERLFRKVLRT